MRYITEVFRFSRKSVKYLYETVYSFNKLQQFVFDITYARDANESWIDCVIRVIEGNMSIYKTHMKMNNLYYDNDKVEEYAVKMAKSMIELKWSPAGRHLRNTHIEDINKNGALFLNNCAAIDTKDSLCESAKYMYLYLRNQAGVGFNIAWNKKMYTNSYKHVKNSDQLSSRIYKTIYGFEHNDVIPIYDNCKLTTKIRKYCELYVANQISNTRLVADIMNEIGVYISGKHNRRSAQIMIGKPDNDEFISLKDYTKNLDRASIGWISNNSVIFDISDDFKHLPNIVQHIKNNGEPGLINAINLRKYGRYGKEYEIVNDTHISMSEPYACLVNPCGEQTLESYEICNLVSTNISNTISLYEWLDTLDYATVFATNVSLLMTDYPASNEIISRNRRIGVSISGLAYIFDNYHMSDVIKFLKQGYDIVRNTNMKHAKHLGIPYAKKVTTIKPDGNLSLLFNTSPGIHYMPFDKYCTRRIRLPKYHKQIDDFKQSGIYYEDDVVNPNQYVFEFPLKSDIRCVKDIPLYEQLMHNIIIQKFWADNNVSMTARFNEKEAENLECIISQTIPFIKTISFLPHDDTIYAQLPYETITEKQYNEML